MDKVRIEYWRGEVCECVRAAAKHGAAEYVDNALIALENEITSAFALNKAVVLGQYEEAIELLDTIYHALLGDNGKEACIRTGTHYHRQIWQLLKKYKDGFDLPVPYEIHTPD